MKYRSIVFLLAFVAMLAPSDVEAQFNGCHVCEELSNFHWVEEPDHPVFEGIAYAHGIMLGGCDSHTHLEICCFCSGLNEEQQGIARRLISDPETLRPEVRYSFARYLNSIDEERFRFEDIGNGMDATLTYQTCEGGYASLNVSLGG